MATWADGFIKMECFMTLEGLKREYKARSFWQRLKHRKEYKRKVKRIRALMEDIDD